MLQPRITISVLALAICIKSGFARQNHCQLPTGSEYITSITVKDVSGTGSEKFPISKVIPLPTGKFPFVSRLGLRDSNKRPVPAQFKIVERYWHSGKSVRHALVHFQPSTGEYTAPHTGISCYYLVKGATSAPSPVNPVTVTESGGGDIRITNGVMTVSINQSPFSIITPAGPLTSVVQGRSSGDVQSSFGRSDIKVTIEDSGPMIAIIKMAAPTIYRSGRTHTHGWALRLYAFAGKSFIKLDYQLQNSAITQKFAAPFYFDSVTMTIGAAGGGGSKNIKADGLWSDPASKNCPALHSGSTAVIIKNFWETWPNGLRLEGGNIKVDLWPSWGAQQYKKAKSPTNLYWLDDMQQVIKEFLIDFQSASQSEADRLALIFQSPPVAVLPKSWYLRTMNTLDMGGEFSHDASVEDSDTSRTLKYARDSWSYTNGEHKYRFGWNNYYGETDRKMAPGKAGNVPRYMARFILSGNPADYTEALYFAIGELNMRPHWLAGYRHSKHYRRIKPTSNPYHGYSWRWHVHDYAKIRQMKAKCGCKYIFLDSGYIDGTGPTARPRDVQHGWFYHMEVAYFLSANPWILDWYKFMAEFLQVRLNQLDPFPDRSSRGIGHDLATTMAAYRATGNTRLLSKFKSYVKEYIIPFIDPVTGGRLNEGLKSRKTGKPLSGPFQLGYLCRPLINYYEEVGGDPEILAVIENLVKWNVNNANFCYYCAANDTNVRGKSSGTSSTFLDVQTWYANQSRNRTIWRHAKKYYEEGLNGGKRANDPEVFRHWKGTFRGRIFHTRFTQV